MGRNSSNHSESPVRGRGSPHRRSPSRRSPSRREKSPARHRSSHRDNSLAREKHSSHTKSPKREISRSPSPRTKRLRRVQAERETEKVTEREHERNHGRGSDKGTHRERGSDREADKSAHREKGLDRDNDKGTHRERGLDREIDKGAKGSARDNGKGMHRETGLERETGKDTHMERGKDRETEREKKERRSGRDDIDGKSSRSRHGRSTSPSDRHHKSRHRSRSPQLSTDTRERDEMINSRGAERRNDDDDDSVARMKAAEEALEAKDKQHKPSFELSGKLAAETNRVKGVTLLFTEPSDARKPDVRWRLYVFKAGEVLNEPLYIHRQSCYLFGRERRVADIPTDHPSCSKQHAVIQFRQVEKEQPDGTLSKQVRPCIMDLGSTNKTFLNENPIEPQRYYELFERDTIKFGNSSREYVLLHENSAE